MSTIAQYQGTGKRKTSVARVRLAAGSGKIVVNGRNIENYFCTELLRGLAVQPLSATETTTKFDIAVNVSGGANGSVVDQADGSRLIEAVPTGGPFAVFVTPAPLSLKGC